MDEREDVREQIYKKICEETILQYKSDTLDIDSMEVDTEDSPSERLIMDRTLYQMLYKEGKEKKMALLSLELLGNKAAQVLVTILLKISTKTPKKS